MSDTPQQAQLRRHLAEIGHAFHGVGSDVAIDVKNLGDKIDRLGSRTAKELKYDLLDIQDDFARLGRRLDVEIARLPQNMKEKATAAAVAIGSGAVRIGGATKDAFEAAGEKAVSGTKNALAAAAGVNRKPMKEWHTPSTGDRSEPP